MNVQSTTYASQWIQLLTGLTGLHAMNIDLPAEHAILGDVLKMETFVQFVEFAFYGYFLSGASVETMATTRYYDWMLTTPTMLFSTMAYLKYQDNVAAGKTTDLAGFVKEHTRELIIVVVSNMLMLLCGYLGETGRVSLWTSQIAGFLFFALTFKIIHEFAAPTAIGRTLFKFMVSVWGCYGLAAMLPDVEKNIAYNGLDIIAKNFFGVYLYLEILRKAT